MPTVLAQTARDDARLRFQVFSALVIGLVAFLGARLAQMQLVDRETYATEAEGNAIETKIVRPARGYIYDRHGTLLVDNETTITVLVAPRYFDEANLALVAELAGVPFERVRERYAEIVERSAYQEDWLLKNVPFWTFARLQENQFQLRGISFREDQQRRYHGDARLTHVLGYVNEISADNLDAMREQGYRLGDRVGVSGIEQEYEAVLRGRVGREFVLKNVHGMEVEAYEGGEQDVEPESGFALTLTVDAKVQALAESLFANKRGGAVMMDAKTGGIISMVSAPDYDLDIYRDGFTQAEVDFLYRNPEKPDFNRATMANLPPGSTWKPFMAAAADELGLGRDHPLLERDRRHERLPRRARRERRLRGPVEVGLLRVPIEELDLGLGEPVAVDVEVEVGRRDHRDDPARLDVEHDRPAPLAHEQALGERLDLDVDGERERGARLGLDVLRPALVRLDVHAVDVDEPELAADPAPEDRLVLGLEPRLPDPVAQPEPLLLHPVELVLADLVDEPERVREPGGAVVPPLLVLAEADAPEPVLVLLEPGERPERDVLEEDVLLVPAPGRDLVVPGPDLAVGPPGELGHEREVGLVEVPGRHGHAQRRLVVDEEDPVPVVDVAPGGADDLGLDRVALGLRRVLLRVQQLHLDQPGGQEREDDQDGDAEDPVPDLGVVAGGGGERGHRAGRGEGGERPGASGAQGRRGPRVGRRPGRRRRRDTNAAARRFVPGAARAGRPQGPPSGLRRDGFERSAVEPPAPPRGRPRALRLPWVFPRARVTRTPPRPAPS